MSNFCINKAIDCKIDISKFSEAEETQQKQICTSHDGEFFNTSTQETISNIYSEYPMCIGDASPFSKNQTFPFRL